MKIALGIVVFIGVMLALVWAGVAVRLEKMTDGNGVTLSRYGGVYGYPGGTYVQAVVVNGWVIFHAVDSRGEWCEIGRPATGGLAMGRWPSRTLPDPSADDDRASLTPGGDALRVGYGAYDFPRRPRDQPKLDSMWSLDGKSGELSSCAPRSLQRLQLLRLTLAL